MQTIYSNFQIEKYRNKRRPIVQRFIVIAGWIFLFLTILLIMLFIHLRLFEYGFDDAFIHFRIVENWFFSGTPYFNINDPIKASSSSGWIISLYTILGITSSINASIRLPQIVAVLNSFMITIASFIFYTIILRICKLKTNGFTYLAFSLIYFSLVIRSSLGLMETPTTLVIIGLAFVLFIQRKKISITFFVISIFFRLELGLVFILIIAYSYLSKRFQPRDIIIYSFIGALPFALIDYINYGTLFPNTINAKSTVYEISFSEQIGILISSLGNSYKLFPFFERFSIVYLFILIFIPMVLLILFTYRTLRRRNNIIGEIGLIIYLWGIIILFTYIISGVVIFSWYEPLFTVPLFLVIWLIMLNKQDKRYSFWNKAAFIPILILQSLLLIQILIAALTNPAYSPGFAEGARTRQYIQVGGQLYEEYPQANLMSSEIGGLGYGFKGNIIDAGGLVSPEALEFHPLKVPEERSSGGLGGIPTGFVASKAPEIIVSYDIFIESLATSGLIEDYNIHQYPLFLEEDRKNAKVYTPWGSRKQSLWGINHLYVFIHKYNTDLDISNSNP